MHINKGNEHSILFIFVLFNTKCYFMKYSTVFLDLDDTLIDTIQNTRDAVEELYEDYRLDKYFKSFDDFYKNYFQPNNLFLWSEYEHQRISKEYLLRNRFIKALESVDEIDEKHSLKINNDYIRIVVRKPILIKVLLEKLDYLKPKYKICILSNGFTEMQYNKIRNAGLAEYFDDIILSDKIGINKPQREIFDYAINRSGTPRKEIIMIGDNFSTDITGAHNAQIDQLWYNPKRYESKEFVPTYTINSLTEIMDIL